MLRVAFYKHRRDGLQGIFDRLIRVVTRGPYSHCELVFNDIGYAYSASIQDGGCRFKYIQFDPTHWNMIPVSLPDVTAAWDFCRAENGKRYDFPGAFRFLWPAVGEAPDKWFCSEIVTAALMAGGCRGLVGVKPWQVHPNRLSTLLKGAPA